MTETTIPLKQHGINIDADSVRSELEEAPEAHNLSLSEAEFIQRLSDEEINRAITDEADDHFWAQHDAIRRRAIATLARDIGVKDLTVT